MSLFRIALVLGLLSAVGPFAIDMYLPAMPAIRQDLAADVVAVQQTLTVYFVAFGIAQLVYGPWADQVGRKLPLYVGLGIFTAASVGCALAPSIGSLIAFRALQGLGGAVLMVVPRAIIRDMYTGPEATKLMALVMLVISVSPMLAPLAGSGLIAFGSWRLIFWMLCAAAMVSLLLTALALPETLGASQRVPVNLRSLWRGTKTLMRDPIFMGLTLIGGFGFASFMVFIASAAFVYSGQFGLSPTGFSLAFAINAIGFFAASQAAGPMSARFGTEKVVRWAAMGFAGCALALFAVALAGFASLPVIVAGLFCANACLGLIIPTIMVMALDPHGEIAGLASSLGGTLQMVTGGVMVVITGRFFDGTALTMLAAIALCALLTLLLTLLTYRRAGIAA
ncbi:multidrug effflux MFS transporter [Cognatishimia sp. SS12]|uniref:multidrug effflux MFS transporter n=1 Tax=Cognatishimia sp. SS12 TaxID=2979465 RepID=UPI00232D4867|nr:multidrug effflux MFS transporter [Cognatishimia sp. SS12]MDC0738039.1 multidrug effflux MFS transporter [Cognatishimia sp. SS12]